ncbi:MAG: DegV family protein [Solobacterium sp.]|nr:DegV family protein [Solobacterium sp.]MCH4222206.1 DegV family protein [Solobacterium sp.]MCH4266205.1 DegV family protein [Solobacterium sp.]
MKIAYVTDSGTGCSIEELARDGIISIPLQIFDGETTYQDMENLNRNQCIELLKQEKVLKTSQPSPGLVEEAFTSLKNQGTDLIIAVPICNGLSGSASTMTAIANSLDMPIICVDTYTTAVVQNYVIHQIKHWYEAGKSDIEVRVLTEQIISSSETFVIPVDIAHLARGGRMTPSAAAFAKLLRIMPILHLNQETGGRIDVMDKVITWRKALSNVIDKIKTRDITPDTLITIAHVNAIESAETMYHKMTDAFPQAKVQIIELCNPVAAHVGLGGICVQLFRQIS